MKKTLISIFAIALMLALTMPAAADVGDISLYGNVRMSTFYLDRSKEQAPAPNLFDDKDLVWELDRSSSRFGVKFKKDSIGARVEIRPKDGSYVRHWHAYWNFGAGTLVVGQAYTPTGEVNIASCCIEGGYSGDYGDTAGSSRQPLLELQFPIGAGKLRLAAIEPNTLDAGSVVAAATDTDTTLPKIEASFDLAFGPAAITLFGGYNTYDEVVTATDKDYSLDGYLFGGNIRFSQGPFYIKGIIWTAQNEKEYGLDNPAGFNASYDAASDSVTDVDTMGYFAVVGFKMSDKVTWELGYGAVKHERDRPGFLSDKDESAYYYLSVPIKVAKNVTITPEIGKLDEKDRVVNGVSTEEGDSVYYGAYWRINF